MSTSSYHNVLIMVIGDIDAILEDEGMKKIGDNDTILSSPSKQKFDKLDSKVMISEAFQHFSKLYIRYIKVYKIMEKCYEEIINPQIRPPVKGVIELIILRILEVQKELVTWNPPNSHVRINKGGIEENFPWDIIHFDQILMDMKLSPDVLQMKVPKSFQDDAVLQRRNRDETVSAYMKQKHDRDDFYLLLETNCSTRTPSVDQVIEKLQQDETNRQEADIVGSIRQQRRQLIASSFERKVPTEDKAATTIQKVYRGYRDRTFVADERQRELISLGMLTNEANIKSIMSLRQDYDSAQGNRRTQQVTAKRQYEDVLVKTKQEIEEKEGDRYQTMLKDERMHWMTSQLADGKYPKTLDEFYASKQSLQPPGSAESKASPTAGKSDKESKQSKATEKKADAKSEKKAGKGSASAAEEKLVPVPKLTNSSRLLAPLAEALAKFSSESKELDPRTMNDTHKSELAEQVTRPLAYDDICRRVDEEFVLRLKKLELIFTTPAKGKKAGGAKKGATKKHKAKKGKLLPGEKLAELTGLDTSQMISMLIESKLILKTRTKILESFIGEFDFLGSMRHDSDRRATGTWEPEQPSLQQVRQMILDYCILPNISQKIHTSILSENLIKSVMLYGPADTGKTMLVETIAHELGGLLIHLSPSTVDGIFPGNTGPTSLVHMIMSIARDPDMQPVIIYIDECEKMFPRGKASKSQDGLPKLKKDLLVYKRDALTSEHRCLIIGTTNKPEEADTKDLRAFFDKFIYVPYPDYASRIATWNKFLSDYIQEALNSPSPNATVPLPVAGESVNETQVESPSSTLIRSYLEHVNISTLAFISEGYSVGAIKSAVASVINSQRLSLADKYPLQSSEFIDHLSIQAVSYKDDRASFVEFVKDITGLNERRLRVESDGLTSGQKAAPEKKLSKNK